MQMGTYWWIWWKVVKKDMCSSPEIFQWRHGDDAEISSFILLHILRSIAVVRLPVV